MCCNLATLFWESSQNFTKRTVIEKIKSFPVDLVCFTFSAMHCRTSEDTLRMNSRLNKLKIEIETFLGVWI